MGTSFIDPLEPRRLLATVSLDPTFGSRGKVVDAGLDVRGVIAAEVQPDGTVVVLADGEGDFLLRRYLPDGAVDAKFGKAGTVRTHFGVGRAMPSGLALGRDGTIV